MINLLKTENCKLIISLSVLFFFLWAGQAFASAPTDGLVGYWPMDEGSGTITHDTSGNGNNGTINGATWVAGFEK